MVYNTTLLQGAEGVHGYVTAVNTISNYLFFNMVLLVVFIICFFAFRNILEINKNLMASSAITSFISFYLLINNYILISIAWIPWVMLAVTLAVYFISD